MHFLLNVLLPDVDVNTLLRNVSVAACGVQLRLCACGVTVGSRSIYDGVPQPGYQRFVLCG